MSSAVNRSRNQQDDAIRFGPQAALVIVDVQQGFDDPRWGKRNNLGAEANVSRLLAAWRKLKWPIFHVVHDSLIPDSPLKPGTAGNGIKTEAKPSDGEPIYRKSVNSAFIGTELEKDLRNGHVEGVIITGLTTNYCVSTTARMAANLGFKTYVVSDATATFERLALDGSTRPAEEVHLAALSDLNGEFAAVIDTETILRVV